MSFSVFPSGLKALFPVFLSPPFFSLPLSFLRSGFRGAVGLRGPDALHGLSGAYAVQDGAQLLILMLLQILPLLLLLELGEIAVDARGGAGELGRDQGDGAL